MNDHELEPTKRKDGSDTLPARGYSWEPFLPDHLKSLVHGARSPRIVEAVARIVKSEVVDEAPWLLSPIFGDSLERYCRAEARARLLTDHIFRVSDESGPAKVPMLLWDAASRSDSVANRAAESLGLTALSRARLAQLTTTTEVAARGLDDLAGVGKQIRARRQAAIEAAEENESEVETDQE